MRARNAGTKEQARESAPPMLVTVPEAMSLLRVSRGTLYNLIGDGAFPVVKIGGTRFKRADILDFIERSTIRTEAA